MTLLVCKEQIINSTVQVHKAINHLYFIQVVVRLELDDRGFIIGTFSKSLIVLKNIDLWTKIKLKSTDSCMGINDN